MSGEGEGKEEVRKVAVLEKEGNTADLYEEIIIESVGSTEEEVNLNTCTCTTYHSFLLLVPSLFSIDIKYGCQGGQGTLCQGKGREWRRQENYCVVKGGKHRRFIWRDNYRFIRNY